MLVIDLPGLIRASGHSLKVAKCHVIICTPSPEIRHESNYDTLKVAESLLVSHQ